MKNLLKSLRFALATLLVIIASQVTVLADAGTSQTDNSSLSAGQVIGGFAILLFVILLPLIKSVRKAATVK